LLMVIAVIAILAALLLPAIDRARSKAKQTKCIANLNQIGVAFHSFAHDHDDRFPQGVSLTQGGVLEFAQDRDLVPRVFRALSNELVTAELLVCPSSRFPSTTFSALTNQINVSYFVGLNAIPYNSDSWLAGDSWGTAAARILISHEWREWRGPTLSHNGRCNILFADGHVESLTPLQMASAFSLPQLLAQPPSPGSGGTGSGTAGGNMGSPGGGTSGSGAGNSYAGGSAAATAGPGQRGSGSGARSGFAAMENFFQPNTPSPSPGADNGTVNPSTTPTLNRVSEPPPAEAPYVFAAVTKTTNQIVSKSKSTELVQTQAVTIEHTEVSTNVVILSLPGNITLDEKFFRWWLVLAVLAIILGVFIGTRRGRRKKPRGDAVPGRSRR
jgi:prepilin-type processing-associated H-X9-DG protein